MGRPVTLRTAIGLLALAAALGCAGVGDFFQEPEVRLDRVVIRSLGVTGGALDLVVDVHNPNHFDLRGTELVVGFDVEDSHVGDVRYADDFAVTRGEATTLTLPVRFQWAGVGNAVRTALNSGDIPYKMKGEVSLQTPFGRRSVAFSREGRAPLSRAASGMAIPGSH